jgi:hypothetical protein
MERHTTEGQFSVFSVSPVLSGHTTHVFSEKPQLPQLYQKFVSIKFHLAVKFFSCFQVYFSIEVLFYPASLFADGLS